MSGLVSSTWVEVDNRQYVSIRDNIGKNYTGSLVKLKIGILLRFYKYVPVATMQSHLCNVELYPKEHKTTTEVRA